MTLSSLPQILDLTHNPVGGHCSRDLWSPAPLCNTRSVIPCAPSFRWEHTREAAPPFHRESVQEETYGSSKEGGSHMGQLSPGYPMGWSSRLQLMGQLLRLGWRLRKVLLSQSSPLLEVL